MNYEEQLKQASQKTAELSDKFNTLEAQKQECLKEILRLEGEIRLLQELIKE